MKRALTVAGSDSGGGAGIQADLKTFAAFGVYGTSAVTAVTAQNTVAVTRVQEIDPDVVAAQIDAVLEDIGCDAAKTGMLSSASIIEAVAAALRRHKAPHLVVDPVMISKSGAVLLRDHAVQPLVRLLLPLAQVVTPNLPEAERLAGTAVDSLDARRDAARRILDLGPKAVVIKGGHAAGPQVVDLYYDGVAFAEIPGERIATRSTHGTGCTFSAAIAASLALGFSTLAAVARAREYVVAALRAAPGLGQGAGPLGHFPGGGTPRV